MGYSVPITTYNRHRSSVAVTTLCLYTSYYHDRNMARTDSFFIRASVLTNGTDYNQSAIDLGAYVDALGKSVLRIHNISVQYGTPMEVIGVPGAGNTSSVAFQLTTQSQSAMVDLTNRSVVSSGKLILAASQDTELILINDQLDVGPQDFTDGYLIAVEQMYLGVDQRSTITAQVSVVLECTVETMTQAAAMALALSQQ